MLYNGIAMAIYQLKINHLDAPFGISSNDICYSFQTDESGPFIVSIESDGRIIITKTIQMHDAIAFTMDQNLEYGKKYNYRVKSEANEASLAFETAMELKAPFIKPLDETVFSPIFHKDFVLEGDIVEARLYITGLGLYHADINGHKVGNRYLTPGFNDYDYYLRYQTFDITDLLQKENHIAVEMGDGWYKGRFGFKGPNDNGDTIWGNDYKLCAHLKIQYKGGKTQDIYTDESWTISSSLEKENGIYDGEEIDYNLPMLSKGKVAICESSYHLIPDYGCGIIQHDALKPSLIISTRGEHILDFHQNMVGFIRYSGSLKKGQRLHILHGEVLQQGCFYNANLRSAKAEMTYIGDGKPHLYEPKFTFFGFRYALIEGLDNVDPADFEGIVIYSDIPATFSCVTDNPKINQLIQNAYWGQRGNFIDLPTDCPQRDERLGWTADTQVFVNTACYQMDCYNFYKKYLQDLRGDQVLYYHGDIAKFSPSLKAKDTPGGAVWSDAGTIIPWNLYCNYGDKQLLESSYPMMRDYVEVLIQRDIDQGHKHLILEGFCYGDWLAQDGISPQSLTGSTDHGYIKSIYYYHSLDLLTLAARELGQADDFKRYEAIKQQVKQAILDEWFAPNGKFALDTQTSYVLALSFGVYRDKDRLIQDFKERLRKDLYHMKTGFVGTPLILNCLFDHGLNEEAYRILYNEECPGWLYAVNMGATTIWERWNSILPDGTISGTAMNSLNHYAYGSVCEAIYSRIAGLRNLAPGWKKVEIKPHLNYRMKQMDFSFDSPSGKFIIHWGIKDRFNIKATIPHGVIATLILPDGTTHELSGGESAFTCDIPASLTHPFHIHTPFIDLLMSQDASHILKEILPNVYEVVTGDNIEFKLDTLDSIRYWYGTHIEDDQLKKALQRLGQLER